MRNTILIILAILCHSAIHAQEESTSISRTILKLSPQHFTDNSLKVGVERFSKTYSTSIALFATAKIHSNEYGFDDNGHNGLAGELQVRKYVSPMKWNMSKRGKVYHQGIYGAAYAQGGSYSGDFTDTYWSFDPITGMRGTQTTYQYQERIGNWGFGFALGYQRTLWQVVFIEIFMGGGIQFSDTIVSGQQPDEPYYYRGGITDPGYSGILPKIGMNIGIGM